MCSRKQLRRVFEEELFTLPRIWEELQASARYHERLAEVRAFNKASPWRKRGIALTPCRCASPQRRPPPCTPRRSGSVPSPESGSA